ncbi:MAG: radical SAM family heme chaperone HemW [Candidatus Margulisbacteria bacterium]|nr:radical SAM family heme chaperone HemW [Candidatus Margulisiibacteriota bacterium]
MVSHFYVHIPYCTTKCDYCDFYSVSGNSCVDEVYVDAVLLEIQERYQGDKLETIFFGGGTPSLLSGKQIEKIFSKLNISTNCEITIECNPETLNHQQLLSFRKSGINRLSIGIQSFNEDKLRLIGRKRTVNAREKAELALKVFDNVGIDLMYALPKQKKSDIFREVSLIPQEIKHVSYYALTLEKKTKLYSKLNGRHPVKDDAQAELAEEVLQGLESRGYERYEISNFANKGYECKHNLAYWDYLDYLGVGAGAVSTVSGIRTENIKDIGKYVQGTKANQDRLTENEQVNERLMMNLRTINGAPLEKRFKTVVDRYGDLLVVKEGRLILTNKGFLFHDTIVGELML